MKRFSHTLSRFLVMPALAVITAAWPGPLYGTDGVWTNRASGINWSAGGNWSNNIVADGPGSTANFNTLDITSDMTVHLDTARTNGIIIFGDSDTNSAGSWVLDNNSVAANILTLAGTTPTITVNDLGAGKSATISGIIAGSSGMTKAGAGTLILSNTANSYGGGTTIAGGTLQFDNEACLGAAASITITNGGTLVFGSSSPSLSNSRGIVLCPGLQRIVKWNAKSATINSIISGAGSVNFDDNTPAGGDGGGGGRYQINNANTYTGDTFISFLGVKDPGLTLNNSLALQYSTLDYNLVNAPTAQPLIWFNAGNSSYTIGGLKGNKNLDLSPQGASARNLRIGNNNQDTTYSGTISSSIDATAGITKIGTGTLTLSGNHTFTGPLAIQAGSVSVNTINNTGSAGPLGQGTNIVVMGTNGVAGTLKYTGGSVTSPRKFTMASGGAGAFNIDNTNTTLTITGVIDGGGGLTKTGPGSLSLAATNTYLGDTTVSSGTLNVAFACLCDTSSVFVAAGAKIALNFGGSDTICSLNLGGDQKTPGIYGAYGSAAAFITGTGTLIVTNGPGPKGTAFIIR